MGVQVNKNAIYGAVVFIALGGGLLWARNNGMLGPSEAGPSVVPVAAPLPEMEDRSNPSVAAPPAVAAVAPPSKQRANVNAPQIRKQQMSWQSQTGENFANGGVYTMTGSIMEKHGVNLQIIWEDDVMKQGTALVNFAKAFAKGNPHPTEGAHFMAVMGDGTAATIGSILPEIKELGLDLEVIGSAGYSRGEDQFMGLPAWKANPKAARGGLIAGFLKDGDWNIALKWAGDNGIANNPDDKTWDPNAINWLATDDFVKAGDAYIDGVCQDRPVVINGKRTGETKNVCVEGVVTWTPVDVSVAEKKGGLTTIVSTKEYRSQMPNTIIGLKQWNQANAEYVAEFLAAIFEGGDQVKAYPEALRKGCEINNEIWGNQKNTDYWVKYFHGVQTTDKQGIPVSLGGSSVNNLQDNLALYGLLPGSSNVFAATYTVFANIVKQQYPKDTPTLLPVEKVLNTSYVEAVAKKYGSQKQVAADVPKFQAASAIKQVVSKKAWQINFATGSANFTPDTMAQLNELRMGLLIAGELAIEIHGHTDNTGDAGRNVSLSQARANAVRTWLMQQSPTDFNADRFSKVQGHGQEVPVATNDSETGRAKNRRVEVVMGSY